MVPRIHEPPLYPEYVASYLISKLFFLFQPCRKRCEAQVDATIQQWRKATIRRQVQPNKILQLCKYRLTIAL